MLNETLIQADITLLLPTDKTTVPVKIGYDARRKCCNPVEIKLTDNNKLYQDNGPDYLWVDAY